MYEELNLPAPDHAIEFIANSLGYSLIVPYDVNAQHKYFVSMREKVSQLSMFCTVGYAGIFSKEFIWNVSTLQISKAQQYIDTLRRHLDNYEVTETEVDLVNTAELPPFKLQKPKCGVKINLPRQSVACNFFDVSLQRKIN